MKAFDVIVLAAWVASSSGAAVAQTPPADERERIARERAQVQATFEAQEAQCQQRFVVTPCIDAARRAERDALARLRRQEVLLDEQARKRRAAQRTQAIRESIREDEEHRRAERAAAAGRAEPTERADLAPTPARSERARRETVIPAPAERTENEADRKAGEQERVARREAEQRAVQAHREAVEARNAQRAASGKAPAAPLPVPSGAAR